MNYRHDPDFADFVEYNDLGLPIAHCVAQGLVTATPQGELYVDETYELLLEALGKSDGEYGSLEDLLDSDAA